MYYLIYDIQEEKYLYYNGKIVRCDTLMDCYDYVEFILKREDFDNFKFVRYPKITGIVLPED